MPGMEEKDSIADYRLTAGIVEAFLKEIFPGETSFEIKHMSDSYRFKVPRKLTEVREARTQGWLS